jgi:hypothetical protein
MVLSPAELERLMGEAPSVDRTIHDAAAEHMKRT